MDKGGEAMVRNDRGVYGKESEGKGRGKGGERTGGKGATASWVDPKPICEVPLSACLES